MALPRGKVDLQVDRVKREVLLAVKKAPPGQGVASEGDNRVTLRNIVSLPPSPVPMRVGARAVSGMVGPRGNGEDKEGRRGEGKV